MKTVVCLVRGKLCRIDTEDRQFMPALKEIINTQTRSYKSLFVMEMYLMKPNGKWLKTGDPDAQKLMRLKVPASIRAMMRKNGEMNLVPFMSDPAYGFPDTEDARDDEIHILVQGQRPYCTLHHRLFWMTNLLFCLC
ncbi:hypothetical protein DYB37_012684 [Aphanomyces astaci]|uniref:Uncharacterized protein n=1 Tax=Aphanomyces astaci TaxID=112090 RepID=A0A397FL34_APHAT|nr:hypothetical protein DYB34_014152 [Aphanomyces astaci]RHY67385.1 hypothetical protein DYB38_009575 [Aphanomyces astaci]RHY86935.1 hypothetical protein DYB35_012590 [Aphanomyces astaci]RHZ27237.1 hypothetical protein DYB31_009890 [Aphanomyces astaci]RHZ29814.1 hypothetical protein DYB37_012684 [Aphanomyces astaci]